MRRLQVGAIVSYNGTLIEYSAESRRRRELGAAVINLRMANDHRVSELNSLGFLSV